MNEPTRPSEIAREALRRLAERHLAPTPANYQACYHEIANLPNVAPFPEPQLRQLAGALKARNGEQERLLQEIDAAILRRSWQGVQDGFAGFAAAGGGKPERFVAPSVLPAEFAARLARFVEAVQPALGDGGELLRTGLAELLAQLRGPAPDPAMVQDSLARVAHHASFVAEEQGEIRESLLKLLQLIVANIGELSLDDSWLKGQVDGLLAAIVPPLTLRRLDDMERRLRDVMDKQSRAKARSVAAQQQMREMLSTFIERLATMNESSANFQERIESTAHKLKEVKTIEDMAPLLQDVVDASRWMAEETSVSRNQLASLQERVLATEAELIQLHLELDNASALARHDPLTDVLNRKGLDEALTREIAAMRRKEVPLSLSLLDIDNFKRLNDRHGHEAGDQALVHLADVARRSIRPTDTLARYGGEEFVIVMPETTADQAIEVMTRLQRELTRAIFLADKEKVLITFSAGVAQLGVDESGHDAIKRADRAMYLAKRAGKNRVMAA